MCLRNADAETWSQFLAPLTMLMTHALMPSGPAQATSDSRIKLLGGGSFCSETEFSA